MSEQTNEQTIVQWQTMPAWVVQEAPVQPETYTTRRVTRGERHFQWPPAGVTMPRNLDAERLRESVAALPGNLAAEFTLTIDGRPPAFYLTKRSAGGVVSHWATYALHLDPIYGEYTGRELPRTARRWLGRTPWATALVIAHEVPAWCLSAFADPRGLSTAHLVSDVSNLRIANIDPILYGVMVAGRHWAFVPLAEWRL